MSTNVREQILIDAAIFAQAVVQKMHDTQDKAEFTRLDKVAMRLTSFMGSLARLRADDDSGALEPVVPQEQEGPESPG